MSTVNTVADAQTSRKVVASDRLPSELTEPKFTAAQIEQDCPARLQQIGKEIEVRLKKADKQEKLADDHVVAVAQLLTEAKGLCDDAGFKKFHELFCPQLGKSQAYALRAIAAGKKTFSEHRAEQRDRKQKSRANQRAAAANSVTVPEKSKPQDTPTEHGENEVPSIASQQTLEPSEPRGAVVPDDEVQRWFDERVLEIDHTTRKNPAKRFFGTAVSVEVLERLGKRLRHIAKHKKFDDVEATLPGAVLRGTASDDQPAGDAEAERPARGAEEPRP